MTKIHFSSKEPVAAKKPSFNTESTSFTFMKHQGQNFALLCQAQAFPIPLIRLVQKLKKDIENSTQRRKR